MYTYIHVYIHTCIHTYMYTYIHVYIHTCISIYQISTLNASDAATIQSALQNMSTITHSDKNVTASTKLTSGELHQLTAVLHKAAEIFSDPINSSSNIANAANVSVFCYTLCSST